jgi:hypothetical protein
MKHSDWVQIVESRMEQKKQSLRKASRKSMSKSKKISMATISILMGSFVILASVCVYFFEAPKTQNVMLDETAQDGIYRYFSKQFLMGSWQFRKATFDVGEVNIFISIPKKPSMNDDELEGYIKHSLCPPSKSKVWRDIHHSDLYINLYVDSPRKGSFVQCQNPNRHA